MRQAQAKRQQNISFRRLRHKTKKSCDPVLTTDSKRRLPAPLSELLHKMKSTQLFKDNISESWENSSCSATKTNRLFISSQCPLRIAAIPARPHPSSRRFPPHVRVLCPHHTSLQSQNSTFQIGSGFPDKIGLFWQDRSFSQIRLPVNPPRSNSWHKTHSRKITALHLKPQCAYAFACFRVFRCLGYFRCFDISIVLNTFFPAKHPSLSQAEKTYKTDAL